MFRLLAGLLAACAALCAQSNSATLSRRVQEPSQMFVAVPQVSFGRNSVDGPGMRTIYLAPLHSFAVAERVRLELRAESFNALNYSNWGTPNRFVNPPQFGTITDAAAPGREAQLSARRFF
jgi:hypothetical protein